MHVLCTTSLIISYKNNPYYFHKVAALKKKIGKEVKLKNKPLLLVFVQSVKS